MWPCYNERNLFLEGTNLLSLVWHGNFFFSCERPSIVTGNFFSRANDPQANEKFYFRVGTTLRTNEKIYFLDVCSLAATEKESCFNADAAVAAFRGCVVQRRHT